MTTVGSEPPPRRPTLAEVLTDGIPPDRVILIPTPGTATAADLEQIIDHEDRLCELVDGVLVERAYGFSEAILIVDLIAALVGFVQIKREGFVVGTKAPVQLRPGLIRAADIAYFSRSRLPGGRLPNQAIATVVPDLVVETRKPGNTPAEMKRKSRDYFEAGCRLIWHLEPRRRLAHVLEGVDRVTHLGDADFLDGGVILPGFRLQVGDLWDGGQYGHWGRTERRDKSSCWD